jgi:hypothetical protein
MKLITAIIKPFKVEAAREALSDIGIRGLTVTDFIEELSMLLISCLNPSWK